MGPVGFTIYINPLEDDITNLLNVLKKFADDTKGAKVIRSLQDNHVMQEVISKLCDWATNWSMKFNVSKCKVMHLGKKNPNFQYTMEGKQMITTEEERDVGVLITDL